jgi:hypothetical protein
MLKYINAQITSAGFWMLPLASNAFSLASSFLGFLALFVAARFKTAFRAIV